MRKIKVFNATTGNSMQSLIDDWIRENPKVYIISLNPTDSSSQHGSRNLVCYVLYEERKSEADILNS